MIQKTKMIKKTSQLIESLQRDKTHTLNECPVYDHLMGRLQPWKFGKVEYPFIAIAIAPKSTLTQSASTW